MLVSAKEMLLKAKKEKYAVGQFNINNLEWTKAVLLTAQECNSPVILGVSEGAGKYMGGWDAVVGMVNGLLKDMKITVPVALHIDHGTYEGAKAVIEAGFSSVMFDGSHYPIEENIEKTKELYRAKANLMMDCMRKYLPEGVTFTPTEGGMFLWAKLPNGMSAVDLYRVALAKGVAICPGDPFYEKERNVSTFRINYSNSSDEVIEKGIRILGEACAELIAKKDN